MSLETVPFDPSRAPTGSRDHPAGKLTWLTTLSLDAPLVCLGWLWLLVSCAPEPSRAAGPASTVLVLSVWLAYLADRWLDSWRLRQPNSGSHRHRFARNHRMVLAFIWTLILLFTIGLALRTLDRELLQRGFILLAALLAYGASIHLGPGFLRRSIPREVATAAILIAGIHLFLPPELSAPGLLFALGLLFLADCILIGDWESAIDRDQGFDSVAGRFPVSVRLARLLLAALILIGVINTLSGTHPHHAPAWAGIGLGAFALLALSLIARNRRTPLLPTLADITLMTPWLILFIRHLR